MDSKRKCSRKSTPFSCRTSKYSRQDGTLQLPIWNLHNFRSTKKGHFYNWHKDVSVNNNTPHRKLSISVNLSDPKDYEGGDLEMKNYWGSQDLKMPTHELRKQGTVIVFPSMLMHRVTEVKKGTRYSLVQWYSGPQFT